MSVYIPGNITTFPLLSIVNMNSIEDLYHELWKPLFSSIVLPQNNLFSPNRLTMTGKAFNLEKNLCSPKRLTINIDG